MNWKKEEDEVLIKTVRDYFRRRVPIGDAFERVSKLIGRPISACSSRWYSGFAEIYGHEAPDSKTVSNNGPWNSFEDERLLNIVLESLKEGNSIENGLQAATAKIGRTFIGVQKRWYTHVWKRNRLTIEVEVERAKDLTRAAVPNARETTLPIADKETEKRMDQDNGNHVLTTEEQSLLISEILTRTIAGGTISAAIKDVSDVLGKPYKTVNGYWYNHLYKKYRDQVQSNKDAFNQTTLNSTVKTGVRRNTWTEDDDERFIDIMRETVGSGLRKTDGLKRIARELNRPLTAVSFRWYNVLSKLIEERPSPVSEIPIPTESQVTETPIVAEVKPPIRTEQDEVQSQPESVSTLSDPSIVRKGEELLTFLKDLVRENGELKRRLGEPNTEAAELTAEVERLKAKASEAEAESKMLREAYDELTERYERLRGILIQAKSIVSDTHTA